MREAAGEASPAIHFQQQVRDLHMREHSIEPVPQFVGFLRNVVFQRTDLQTCAVQLHVRQLAVTRERIALIEGLAQQGRTLLKIHRRRDGDGGRQGLFLQSPVEVRTRHQVVLEGAEMARSDHRNITGAQAFLSYGALPDRRNPRTNPSWLVRKGGRPKGGARQLRIDGMRGRDTLSRRQAQQPGNCRQTSHLKKYSVFLLTPPRRAYRRLSGPRQSAIKPQGRTCLKSSSLRRP
jgi:hypothetical protein